MEAIVIAWLLVADLATEFRGAPLGGSTQYFEPIGKGGIGAPTFYHLHGSAELHVGDGRRMEDLARTELVCVVYKLWLLNQLDRCDLARRNGHPYPEEFCGGDLRAKAEACSMTH